MATVAPAHETAEEATVTVALAVPTDHVPAAAESELDDMDRGSPAATLARDFEPLHLERIENIE